MARRRGFSTALRLALLTGAVAVAFGFGASGEETATERRGTAILLAAGDIAECDSPGDEATARLLDAHPSGTVATLGDNAYSDGARAEFAACFDPSWGRHKARMRPATGNHDYGTKDAAGYAAYFGKRGGPFDRYYYSYDLAAWHVVVLNSDCWRVGGCEDGDPMIRWLRRDLLRNETTCTLAYWHRPPFSSGRYGDPEDTDRVRPLWATIVRLGVDVVLTGHEHSYERFVPMDAAGKPAGERGARLFVVGTGGAHLRRYRNPPLPATAARRDDTWGVLELTLRPKGYDWRFLPVAGRTFADSGTGRCH